MEELFNLPMVQNKPPPESSSTAGSETVDSTKFQDTLNEKIQDASANQQEQTDDVGMEAEAAASQIQQQIISVTNHAYDELVTPGGEMEADNASALQDALMALTDGSTQAEGFDIEDLAVVSEEQFLEGIMENEEAPEKIKFAAEMAKDITSLDLEVENSLENPLDTVGGQVIEIEQVQVQTELQNAEIAQEDTNLIDIDMNVEDLDALDIGAKDLEGMMEMDEVIESDRLAETLLPRIINRIIDAVENKSDKGTTSLRIQLDPKELGKIGVRITMREDGIHISLAADSNTTSKLLQDNASALTQALASAGVNLSSFDMGEQQTFQQHTEGQASQNGSPRIHLINEPIKPINFPANPLSADSSSGLDYRI